MSTVKLYALKMMPGLQTGQTTPHRQVALRALKEDPDFTAPGKVRPTTDQGLGLLAPKLDQI